MPISKPHSSFGASNTESCSKLAFYLEKENKELDKLSKKTKDASERRNIENRKQFFFNHSENNISTIDVIFTIDKNKKKLSKRDAKYFAPTINFSQQELKHLLKTVTQKENIKSVWELNQNEYQQFNFLLQEFIRKVMNNYAKNFNREDKGLKSGDDLVYFAKIEHFRKFKGIDKEVIDGVRKTGEFKPGMNSHAHIIVSRKDKTQKMKLMPIVKERNTSRTIGGNKYKVGFDRMKWIQMNETSFDVFFKYKRPELEKFKNQYILKNGSPSEKNNLLKSIKEKSIVKQHKEVIVSQNKEKPNLRKEPKKTSKKIKQTKNINTNYGKNNTNNTSKRWSW